MEDFQVMECCKPSNSLYEYHPYDLFLEQITCLLVLADFLKHIPIICIVHNNATVVYVKYKPYHSDCDGSSKNACL